MALLIDLRYMVPPLLNLISLMSLTSQSKPAFPLAGFLVDQPISMLAFLLVAVFLMLLFLFFSVELPLTPHRISLRARGFSIALCVSLVASMLLHPSLFWVAYLFIIITAPWHTKLFHLFIHFFHSFALTLQSFPTVFINITQNHENPDQARTLTVNNPIRSQQSSEPDCV
ncbi:hypothetical protein REPUB_Repub08aG0213300 [Reevesia pubescens]